MSSPGINLQSPASSTRSADQQSTENGSRPMRYLSQENALRLQLDGLASPAISNRRHISLEVFSNARHGAAWLNTRRACRFDMHPQSGGTWPNTVTIPHSPGPFAYEYLGFTPEVARKLWAEYASMAPELEELYSEGEIQTAPFIKCALLHMRETAARWEKERQHQRRLASSYDHKFFIVGKDLRSRYLLCDPKTEPQDPIRDGRDLLTAVGIKPAIIDIIMDDRYVIERADRPVLDWARDVVVLRKRFLLRMDAIVEDFYAELDVARLENTTVHIYLHEDVI
ncbi:hypothetical protein IWX91DRAFT_371690 [Phyllosticta citricarpa]